MKNRRLVFTKINPSYYSVMLGSEDVGCLMRDDDPYFYWHPSAIVKGVAYNSNVLAQIAAKLRALNESNQ